MYGINLVLQPGFLFSVLCKRIHLNAEKERSITLTWLEMIPCSRAEGSPERSGWLARSDDPDRPVLYYF
jgi:hypothetical protein